MTKRIASAHIEETITLRGENPATKVQPSRTVLTDSNSILLGTMPVIPAEPDPLLLYQDQIADLEASLAKSRQEIELQRKAHDDAMQALKADYLSEARALVMAELQEASRSQQSQLELLLTSIDKHVQTIMGNCEIHVATILSACLKKLVDDCYRDEVFRVALLTNTARHFASRQLLSIEVSTEDYRLLEVRKLIEQAGNRIVWRTNDKLVAGDCIVTLEDGLRDASLSHQVSILQQVLEGLGNAGCD